MEVMEFECPVCGMKYDNIPEVCSCGNQVAAAQSKGYRVWLPQETSTPCPDPQCTGHLVSIAFGWTGGMELLECNLCHIWGYSRQELEDKVVEE